MLHTIRLLYFPPHDLALQDQTEKILRHLDRDGRSDAELVEVVTVALRRTFPEAVIRSRDPLAEVWPGGSTWYVYRDGSPDAGLGQTADEAARGPGRTLAP